MYSLTSFATTILVIRNLTSRSPLRGGFLLVALGLALAWLALPQTAQAVSPAPDGGYSNGNTAEGSNALFSLTTGGNNAALGFQALFNNTSGSANTATGADTLLHNTTGVRNTADGFDALLNNTASDNTASGFSALANNTTGTQNTANGSQALFSNTTGQSNTAVGFSALQHNTSGNQSTAVGANALMSSTVLGANTAVGFNALSRNTGDFNTATGTAALSNNSTGGSNTANGILALTTNTTGSLNTAVGEEALFHNSTANLNTAIGAEALLENTTGENNTAIGGAALGNSTTANDNVATGDFALQFNTTGNDNTAVGFQALQSNTTGATNIAIGGSAGLNLTTGNNNIDIGNAGVAGEAGKIRIGKQGTQNGTFIAGISGVAVTGSAVVVNSNGKLGVATSSARFKEAIKPMDKTSETILALKPVTFRYKEELDPDGIPQFGLIAEEVEKVNPDLITRDDEGRPTTVRYEAVNAMLLNEFLKEHRQVEEQKAGLAEMKSVVSKQEELLANQQKQIEALTAAVRKVSERVELGAPAVRMAANDD